MSRYLVGSTYGRFCIKFPQSRMKDERHRLSTLSLYSVFNKSRKPANFAVYCGIFSGYFIFDKNRSVLFWDQLYVFWDCLYSGSVFDSVCFSPFFRFETENQSLLDLNNFRDLTLASFLC
jgi:hypothetical protein